MSRPHQRASARSGVSQDISLQINSRCALSADEDVRAPSNRRPISETDDFLGNAAPGHRLLHVYKSYSIDVRSSGRLKRFISGRRHDDRRGLSFALLVIAIRRGSLGYAMQNSYQPNLTRLPNTC